MLLLTKIINKKVSSKNEANISQTIPSKLIYENNENSQYLYIYKYILSVNVSYMMSTESFQKTVNNTNCVVRDLLLTFQIMLTKLTFFYLFLQNSSVIYQFIVYFKVVQKIY